MELRCNRIGRVYRSTLMSSGRVFAVSQKTPCVTSAALLILNGRVREAGKLNELEFNFLQHMSRRNDVGSNSNMTLAGSGAKRVRINDTRSRTALLIKPSYN